MAESTQSQTTSAPKAQLGVIKGVQGRVLVERAESGETRILKDGQSAAVFPGDTLVAQGSSAAVLVLDDLGSLSLGHDQTITLSDALLALLNQEEEGSAADEPVNFDVLAEAIESGANLEALLPATAAGEGGSPNTSGSSAGGAPRFTLTAEEVTPNFGFETSAQSGAAPSQDEQLNPNVSQNFILTAQNNAPEAQTPPPLNVDEDVRMQVDLSEYFSDEDADQSLSYTIEGLPEGLSFDPLTGVISGTPSNADALFNDGVYTIRVTADDNSGAENSQVSTEFALQVQNINDAPEAGDAINLGSIEEDSSLTIPASTLLEGSRDIDGDVLSIASATVDPAAGEVVVNDDGSVSFTPATNWHGELEIAYVITDGNGGTVSNVAQLQVTPVNDNPLALDDGPFQTEVGVALNVNVLQNDTDVDGDSLQVVAASAENGIVEILPNGVLRYTPNEGFEGDDRIQYQVSDGQGGLAEAAATVSALYIPGTLNIVDQATVTDARPVFTGTSSRLVGDLIVELNGESYTVTPDANGNWRFELPEGTSLEDGAYTLEVSGTDRLGNAVMSADDFVIDALMPVVTVDDQSILNTATPVFTGTVAHADGPVTVSIAGNQYSVTPSADGTWSLTLPDADALQDGDYQVTVTASDAQGNQAQAEDAVTIDARLPSVTIDESDVLYSSTPTLSGVALDTDGLVVLSLNGKRYELEVSQDNRWSLTLPQSDALTDGAYNVVVEVQDAQGNSASDSDDFIIDAVDDAPIVSGTLNATVLEGNLGDVTEAQGDIAIFDPDTGPQPQFENTVLNGQFGQLVLIDGTWTYTLDQSRVQSLSDGVEAQDVLTLTATDGTSQNIVITILGSDDAAVIAGQFVGSVSEADVGDVSQVRGALTINDVDDADAPVFEPQSVSGSYGDFEITNGEWLYTLNQSLVQDMSAGQSRIDEITVVASDGSTQVLSVTINGTNDAPVVSVGTATTEENTVLNASVPAASDVDGTIASYELVDNVASGALTFNTDGSYEFNPGTDFDDLAVGESREVSFTYRAFDNEGTASAPQTITLTVTGSNDVPVVSAGSASTEENTVLNGFVPTASDVDGTIASYELVDDVASGALTFNADGSYEFNPGSDFDDLAVGETREVSFTYRAFDDEGTASAPQTITVTVTGSNDAPLASAGSASTEENTVLNASVPAASDVDGTITSYELVDDVASGALTFNADGSYEFNPGTDFDDLAVGESREVSFTYRAFDNEGTASAPQTITVTVTGSNDAPLASAGSASTEENTVLNASVPAASDVDGTITSYELVDDVASGVLTFNADGSYEFNPGTDFDDLAVGESREVSFTYRAFDNEGTASAPQTITVTVTGSNDAPVASSASARTDENVAFTASVPVASDIDGTVASYTLISDVAEGSLSFNADGSYRFDPGSDFEDLSVGESRDVSFTYYATDDQGSQSAPATITITVEGAPTAPVISVSNSSVSDSVESEAKRFTGDGFPSTPGNSWDDATGTSASNLTLSGPSNITVQFVQETAGYKNSLGWYHIDTSGQLGAASIIWEDGNMLRPRNVETLSNVPEGEVGFFLISNGYSRYKTIIDEVQAGNGVLRFENASGEVASSSDSEVTLVYYTGGTLAAPSGTRTELSQVFHASHENLNRYGVNRSDSGTVGDDETLRIGFEDLPINRADNYNSGPDWDLRDLVFEINITSVDYHVYEFASNLSIADDGSELVSAKVQLQQGRSADEFRLDGDAEALAASFGISVAYDAQSKTLNLSGSASIGDYETLLSQIQLASTESLGNDPRQIAISVVDSDGLSSEVATIQLDENDAYDFSGSDFLVADDGIPLTGGAGDDVLVGSTSADRFIWRSGDDGSVASPAVDTVRDFTPGAGGDVLDLSDLLEGESATAASLDEYLSFSSEDGNTIVSVDTDGSGAQGVTQRIVLEGVDLTSIGTDQQILQQLLDDGNLAASD